MSVLFGSSPPTLGLLWPPLFYLSWTRNTEPELPRTIVSIVQYTVFSMVQYVLVRVARDLQKMTIDTRVNVVDGQIWHPFLKMRAGRV